MNKDSWLYSDSFLKRAFAIWGHYMVANLIVGAAVGLVVLFLAITLGMTFSSFAPRMQPPMMQGSPWMNQPGVDIEFDMGTGN